MVRKVRILVESVEMLQVGSGKVKQRGRPGGEEGMSWKEEEGEVT